MTLLKSAKSKISPLEICHCGLAEYKRILDLQYKLREKRHLNKIPNTVLIVEHKPVITLGARKSANKLLVNRNIISQKKIDIVETRRGGGATAHNPGQLVFYPVINLKQLQLTIREYITKLEIIGKQLLQQFGLESQRLDDFPGLWIEHRKIASIGVRISKFVTYHGMAINFQNDLSIFDLFIPCGLNDIEITSVYKETGGKHPMTEIKKALTQLLIKHFSSEELTEYESKN